jgi:Sec23/Sec24 helical domain
MSSKFKLKKQSRHPLLCSRRLCFIPLAMVRPVLPNDRWNVLFTVLIGERRIRVITHALPTTTSLSEVFASADQVALATLFANKAVERSLTHKLEDSRDALYGRMVEILGAYKSSMTAAGAGASAQLALSENLKSLPVLVLGLLKNVRVIFILYGVSHTNVTIGWYQAKCPDTSRSSGLCPGAFDDFTISKAVALLISILLRSA